MRFGEYFFLLRCEFGWRSVVHWDTFRVLSHAILHEQPGHHLTK